MGKIKFKFEERYSVFLIIIDNYQKRAMYEQEREDDTGDSGLHAWELTDGAYDLMDLFNEIFEKITPLSSNSFLVKFNGSSEELMGFIKTESLNLDEGDEILNKTLASQVYICPVKELETFTTPLISNKIKELLE